jgi:ferredoxin-NADP reductase
MVQDWQRGIIAKMEQATPNTRRFWIQLPDTSVFDFKPGQFVTLDLPISEQRNKRWRSYSIASPPDGTNVLELIIVNVEGGAGTNFIFHELAIGSEVRLRGPQGSFLLPNTQGKDLFLICTGTGIAPFRSMVDYMSTHHLPHNNIYLIFGTRFRHDILYMQEMEQLQQLLPRFKFIPVLSRETWTGASGYVHPIYEGLCSEHQPAIFMLCGWRNMVDEAVTRITALGYDKKDIYTELYG